MGMSGWQKFRTVELPLALPLVAAGVRLSLVQIWATATIAALVSGPGLGNVIASGFFNGNYPKGLGGAIVVAVVALILEVVAAMLQRAVSSSERPDTRGTAPRDTEGGIDATTTDPDGGNIDDLFGGGNGLRG